MLELTDLVEVILPVQDLQRQLAFYRDQLGLAVARNQAGTRVELETGACRLILQAGTGNPGPNGSPHTRLVFRVANLYTARIALTERGVHLGPTYQSPAGLVACDGLDPEHNAFTLLAEAERPTSGPIPPDGFRPPTGRRIWAV